MVFNSTFCTEDLLNEFGLKGKKRQVSHYPVLRNRTVRSKVVLLV